MTLLSKMISRDTKRPCQETNLKRFCKNEAKTMKKSLKELCELCKILGKPRKTMLVLWAWVCAHVPGLNSPTNEESMTQGNLSIYTIQ